MQWDGVKTTESERFLALPQSSFDQCELLFYDHNTVFKEVGAQAIVSKISLSTGSSFY